MLKFKRTLKNRQSDRTERVREFAFYYKNALSKFRRENQVTVCDVINKHLVPVHNFQG